MPNRFTPVPVGTDQAQTIAAMNNNFAQLDNEGITKVFYNDKGKPSMTLGLLPEDQGQGLVLSDNEDRKRIVLNIDSDNVAAFKVFDKDGKAAIAAAIGTDDQPYLKVAKTGYDATTASNDQLIFNSSQNTLKVVETGTTSITPPATWAPGGTGKQTVTITHDLGYKPAIMVFVQNPGISGAGYYVPGLAPIPNYVFLISSFDVCMLSNAHVDTTKLYIDLLYMNSAGSSATGFDAYTWNYKYYLLQETAA